MGDDPQRAEPANELHSARTAIAPPCIWSVGLFAVLVGLGLPLALGAGGTPRGATCDGQQQCTNDAASRRAAKLQPRRGRTDAVESEATSRPCGDHPSPVPPVELVSAPPCDRVPSAVGIRDGRAYRRRWSPSPRARRGRPRRRAGAGRHRGLAGNAGGSASEYHVDHARFARRVLRRREAVAHCFLGHAGAAAQVAECTAENDLVSLCR